MVESNCRFEQVNDFDYAFIKFSGILDVEGARAVADQIAELIPLDYEGHLVVDISEMKIEIANENVDSVVDIVTTKRYYFRRRTAFIIPEGDLGLSNTFYNAAIEREGIIVDDFYNVEDAVKWLSERDA